MCVECFFLSEVDFMYSCNCSFSLTPMLIRSCVSYLASIRKSYSYFPQQLHFSHTQYNVFRFNKSKNFTHGSLQTILTVYGWSPKHATRLWMNLHAETTLHKIFLRIRHSIFLHSAFFRFGCCFPIFACDFCFPVRCFVSSLASFIFKGCVYKCM